MKKRIILLMLVFSLLVIHALPALGASAASPGKLIIKGDPFPKGFEVNTLQGEFIDNKGQLNKVDTTINNKLVSVEEVNGIKVSSYSTAVETVAEILPDNSLAIYDNGTDERTSGLSRVTCTQKTNWKSYSPSKYGLNYFVVDWQRSYWTRDKGRYTVNNAYFEVRLGHAFDNSSGARTYKGSKFTPSFTSNNKTQVYGQTSTSSWPYRFADSGYMGHGVRTYADIYDANGKVGQLITTFKLSSE